MLYVHDRQVRQLPIANGLEAALRSAFFTDHRDAALLEQARSYLGSLHKDRLWLACDCASGPDGTWPMIGPRDGRGGMHPFRFGHVSHLASCAFAGEIRRRDNADPAPGAVEESSGPLESAWDLTSMFPSHQLPGDRREQLSRLLRTAVNQLGIERIHISSFGRTAKNQPMRLLETPFSRLRHLGSQDMGAGHAFRDVGITYLPALPRILHALARKHPDTTGSVGLYLGIVEEALPPASTTQAGFLSSKDQKGARIVYPVNGRVFLPDGDDGRHGPYWSVGLLVANGAGHVFLGDTLALQALDRRTLLPVPSTPHRALAKLLLEQMQFWREWKRLELEVELSVTLFPSPYPQVPAFRIVLPNGSSIGVDLVDDVEKASVTDATVRLSIESESEDEMRKRLTSAVTKANRKDALT